MSEDEYPIPFPHKPEAPELLCPVVVVSKEEHKKLYPPPSKDAGAREWIIPAEWQTNGEKYSASDVVKVVLKSDYEQACKEIEGQQFIISTIRNLCGLLPGDRVSLVKHIREQLEERDRLRAALEYIKDTCEETGLSLDANDLRVDVDNIHEIASEALKAAGKGEK